MSAEARKGLRYHPTVKPVALLEDALLDVTDRGDVVLDPFLGSGSMLIAAERTGRICRAIEIDPLYVDVAIRRWVAVTGDRPVLLDGSPARPEKTKPLALPNPRAPVLRSEER
jgi:DNA modification methylase